VDITTWTYNTGVMVHANVLFYQITRFEQYLDEARLVAHNSLEHFAGRQVDGVRIFPDSPWFNAVMFRGYLALADVTGDTTFCDALLRCLDHGWDHARDRDGLLGPDWSGRSKMDQGYRALLDEAAVVEVYALAARREATAAALAGGAAGPETSAAGVLGNLVAVAGSGPFAGDAEMGAGAQSGLQPLTLRLDAELVSPKGTVGSCRRAGEARRRWESYA